MSTRSYNELWATAQHDLDEILDRESVRTKSAKSLRALTNRYVEYVRITQKLETCYDQMVHPQKRPFVRKLLDGTMGRVLELRHEMVATVHCECIHFDEVLEDMQLTHDNITVPIPHYFLQERAKELQQREKTMEEIMERFGLVEEKLRDKCGVTLEEAVRLIQRSERARQGCLRARSVKLSVLKRRREKPTLASSGSKGAKSTSSDETPMADQHAAAIKIQRVWKGYSTWKHIQAEREREMIFLGMIPPPKSGPLASLPQHQLELTMQMRRDLQKDHDKEYHGTIERIKEDVRRTDGDAIIDGMRAEIRNWFFTFKDKRGKFPDYPSDDEGGYKAAIAKLDEEPQEPAKSKKQLMKGKTSLAQKRKATPQAEQPQSGTSASSAAFHGSAYLQNIIITRDNYREMWHGKVMSLRGVHEALDEDIIRDAQRLEVTTELRSQVDALMRQELELLKIAVLRDKGKKGKKLRAALKKKKKKNLKTGKKRRKERDLTPHRTLEHLYEELVREGIIRHFPKVQLSDFIGEVQYVPRRLEKPEDALAPPLSLADVRRLLTEYCIWPLGSSEVHEHSPMVRSLLLVGPVGTGKTFLANAICTETGATLFDLSARNLVGKYPGRDGLKMLQHLVWKVSRLLQPSVILIEDADRMFIKKLPKVEKSDPKRIKKGLQKLIKSIAPQDRILVLGTSRSPFEADLKALGSTYNKIILIPKPDHTSRYVLWKRLVQQKGGIFGNDIDVSTLAKISEGYSAGSIVLAVNQVLTNHRVALQKRRALQATEFLGPLSKLEPVYKEEEEAFRAWYLRTPLVKRKMAAMEPEDSKKTRQKLVIMSKKETETAGDKRRKKKGKQARN